MENAAATFDDAAVAYEAQLQQGLDLSGESADYFMRGRLEFLVQLLQLESAGTTGTQVLDFGCGVGNATEPFVELFAPQRLVGLDCSNASVQLAQAKYPNHTWLSEAAVLQHESFDLVHTTGVFHHIEPIERDAHLQSIYDWLRPGGYFAFFENNPWNPGTRWVMSRIPFDRDAICLPIPEAQERLQRAGFEILAVRSLFFFPRSLAWLRGIEPLFQRTPLGAQYLILGRRPK